MASQSGFDTLAQAAPAAARQQREIKEQQRVQQQNTVGAQLLDAINNASNIKPQTKDENGNIIHNPEYDTAQQNKVKLLQQYTQLNSPEQHASFAQHLHGLIFGHPETNPQQPALSTNSSPNQPPPPVVAQGQDQTPTAPAPLHPMAPAPPDHPLHAITKGIGELGSAIKNHATAFAHPLPAPTQPDPALIAKYYKDPAEVAFERNKELWQQRGQNSLAVQELKNEAIKLALSARPPRLLSQTTVPDLLEQIKTDPTTTIYDPNGNELSPARLAELPPNTIAREFRAGNQIFYALGDQNSKTVNVGGHIYDVPAIGAITAANSTDLGTATGALAKTHEVPGMNPGEKIQLTTAPTATPGMTAAPVSAPTTPSAQPPTPTLKTRPQSPAAPSINPGARTPGTIPTGAAVKANPSLPTAIGTAPPPFAKGTMLSQGRSAEPVVAAMSVVAANVFGGNGDKPIWENASMYDKPELRKALNNALTLNALANPGTEDNPSFLQTLATAIGATGWSQEQINDANVKARQELQRLGGDEALKQFAREAALQEDLSALRTATKASAAQGSIRTLVRAAPVYNISSAQDFRNQLGTVLSTASSSMKGYPAINPEYVKWWERGTAAAKGGPVSTNAPKAPGATPERPPSVPDNYVFNANGPKGRGWYAPTAAK